MWLSDQNMRFADYGLGVARVFDAPATCRRRNLQVAPPTCHEKMIISGRGCATCRQRLRNLPAAQAFCAT